MEALAEPISPELVLVDRELRRLVLRQLCEQASEQARSGSPGRSPRGEAALAPEPPREARRAGAEAGGAAAAGAEKEARAIVRASQWWLAVLVYSTAIVALVLGSSIALRLLF